MKHLVLAVLISVFGLGPALADHHKEQPPGPERGQGVSGQGAKSSGGKSTDAIKSQYIHRPDSTQYHPGGKTPDAGAAGVNAAPAADKSQYIHRPDSTQYHPGGKKSGVPGGVEAEDDWETPAAGKAYVHRPDSTQYHPGGKGKSKSGTD